MHFLNSVPHCKIHPPHPGLLYIPANSSGPWLNSCELCCTVLAKATQAGTALPCQILATWMQSKSRAGQPDGMPEVSYAIAMGLWWAQCAPPKQ